MYKYFIILAIFIAGCNINNDISVSVNNKPNFVLFSATWCGPCQKLKHDLQSTNLLNNYNFYIVDIDERPDLRKKYNVEGVPTYMIFKNGRVTKRQTGYRSIQDIYNFLR